MSIIAPGTSVPEFKLQREDGEDFTREDLLGKTTVLVFYPFAFSPVCTDQLQIYEEALEDFAEQGATLYAVSTDHSYAQKAFKERLGVTIGQLSDFEPKGAAARVFGAAGHDQPRTRDRRPRRRRALELPRPDAGRPPGRGPDLRRAGGLGGRLSGAR
jgi:peroxiredoxin